MVSTGDTASSLHIRGGGGTPDQLKLKVSRSAQIVIVGRDTPDQLKLKVPRSAQIFIGGGGIPDQLKLKVTTRSAQIFIFRRGGCTPD